MEPSSLKRIVRILRNKGIRLEFIDTPELAIDTATGEFMMTVIGAFATMERLIIHEHHAEGIPIAKAKG